MSGGRLWIAKMGDKLPEVSAVYAMYGGDLECLYVGSTVNLKSRIASHRYRKLAVFPCSPEDLRDVEERIYRALRPSLNQASSISRSGYPSRPIREDFSLRLESRGTWWEWKCGSLSLGFRTIASALDNWPTIKELSTDRWINVMENSSRSLRQSSCFSMHVPLK